MRKEGDLVVLTTGRWGTEFRRRSFGKERPLQMGGGSGWGKTEISLCGGANVHLSGDNFGGKSQVKKKKRKKTARKIGSIRNKIRDQTKSANVTAQYTGSN